MEEGSFPYENCSNFTGQELATIALVRCFTAGSFCTIVSVVLVVLVVLTKCCYQRVCGTAVKRLTIGLTAFNAVHQLFLTLHVEYYYHPELVKFCIAVGFLDLYLATVQLYLALGIFLILFFKVLKVTTSWKLIDEYYEKAKRCTFTCHNGWKINKLEVTVFLSTVVLPLLFDWIPFATNSFGPYGPWCWIRSYEKNCSMHTAGLWEQRWLWDASFGLVAFLMLVLFIVSLCLLGYGIKNAVVRKLIIVATGDSVISLALMFMLRFIQTIPYFFHAINKDGFIFRVVNAVIDPISDGFVPLALLMTIHFPFSSMIVKCVCCKSQNQLGEDHQCDQTVSQTTAHRSSDWSVINKPSHTTWDCPHSSNEISESAPFARDKQKQDYGINF